MSIPASLTNFKNQEDYLMAVIMEKNFRKTYGVVTLGVN